MASFPFPLILAISLIQALAACSSAPLSAPDKEISAAKNNISSYEPAIGVTSSPDSEIAENNRSVQFIDAPDNVEKRFFRPLLAIDDNVSERLPDALSANAEISYVVMDLERGVPIARHNADRHHIPASSAKLATALIALQRLGPEHRFLTELRTNGYIENGVLKGDLILKGGGDPVLDLPDLLPLIDELARLSVRSIEGAFLIDDSLLPRFTEIEPSQPNEAAYNPGLGALSIAFNRVNLRWEGGGTPLVETVPRLDEASFEGAARNLLPPGGVRLKRFEGGEAVWQLADRGARQSKRSLPVKDAGLYAGRVFTDLAGLYGIELPAPRRASESTDSRLIAVHKSRPLRELVRDMLWYSNNLVAELIGLAATKTVDPNVTSLEGSAEHVLSELQRQMPDTSWDKAKLDNHSGLSSKARLTPEQLAAILRHGWHDGGLSSLLPASGWSGTLARRFNSSDQALRIWAKTGSINYVMTLGGYLLSSSHSPAAFVIMISDEKARATYDAQPQRTHDSEKKAQAWKKNAEKVMRNIVERWLEPAPARPDQSLHAQSLIKN